MRIRERLIMGCALLSAASLHAVEPDFRSGYLSVGLSRTAPAFSEFDVDSLGKGKLADNPAFVRNAAAAGFAFESNNKGAFTYSRGGKPVWQVACGEKTVTLRSEYESGRPGSPALPFTVMFNQKKNHATLLGLMRPGERKMALPCVLHLPDRGTLRITSDVPGAALDYDAVRQIEDTPNVKIAFPAATAERPSVLYRLEVTQIYPQIAGIEGNPLYDGFRRDFLNLFQVNPRLQMLGNNASSDPVAFTVYKYAELAAVAPPLADGLTCLDLVRMTLDRYLAGALGYGQVGYGMSPTDAILCKWATPWTSTDSMPSLVLAACRYAEASKDRAWAEKNYAGVAAWARQMVARDTDGNGLIEYPSTGNYNDRPLRDRRPANWWDTINFGHEDAYSNALIYHAARRFAALARELGHADDAADFDRRADRLKAAYLPGFLNPETGIIAGWRSKDGQLHDYGFTFVNGAAVAYGLVEGAQANAIMDKLLAKMKEVGYTRFDLGLPGNLVPVRKGDYVFEKTPPERFGEPLREDGSDGFQYYENGGATGCFSYFLIKALYTLGRAEDARRIFHPMLKGYADGNFQGFEENGMSRDWRDWKGGGHGYEGLLVDNYFTLLAVFDDVKAGK